MLTYNCTSRASYLFIVSLNVFIVYVVKALFGSNKLASTLDRHKQKLIHYKMFD